MDRQSAWELLTEHTKSESLRKHALAVEACMRAYARKFGEDEERWAVVGLIHDFDYEMYPDAPDHPLKGSEILAQRGYPEEVRRTIPATRTTRACRGRRQWREPCSPVTSWPASLRPAPWFGPTAFGRSKQSR